MMQRLFRGRRLFFCLFLILTHCQPLLSGDLKPVKIRAAGSPIVKTEFQAEIVATPETRAQGLMFRSSLKPNQGMLFLFPENTQGAFWMKDTLIPLDMIFISEAKRIVSITAQAQPQTLTPRYSALPYRYVLEVPGGRAAELGIAVGDEVEFASSPPLN